MLNEDKNRELENLTSEIDKYHNDNAKIHQALKLINRKSLQNLMVLTQLENITISLGNTSKHISTTRRNQS